MMRNLCRIECGQNDQDEKFYHRRPRVISLVFPAGPKYYNTSSTDNSHCYRDPGEPRSQKHNAHKR